MILQFILGLGIGYALARVGLFSYMKWQEKHRSEYVISNNDISHGAWVHSICYGFLLAIIPIEGDAGIRSLGFIVINPIWLGLIVLGEYIISYK